MYISNLTTKPITEFGPEDTIYLSHVPRGGAGTTCLCQFQSYDPKTHLVTGKVLQAFTNPELYKHDIERGWILQKKLTTCALYGMAPERPLSGSFHYFDVLGRACYDSPEQQRLTVPVAHPTYAMISIGRVSGSQPESLFGSSIKVRDQIRIDISEAEIHRNELHTDSFVERRKLLDLRLSPQQFTDLMTNLNADGIPATIVYRMDMSDSEYLECPYVSKMDQFQTEFEQRLENMTHQLDSMLEKAITILNNPKNISKGERELILKELQSFSTAAKGTMPFMAERFIEHMDTVMGEVKAATTAYLERESARRGIVPGAVPVSLPEPRAITIGTCDPQ